MHVITPVEKDKIMVCCLLSNFVALSCKKSIKNPHQILKGTSTVARMTAGALVFPPSAVLQGCRATEGEEEISVPASEVLNELEIVIKGKRRDTQQKNCGRGKAETVQGEKFSIDQNVLVRSIRESFCLHFFSLVTRIINPERN